MKKEIYDSITITNLNHFKNKMLLHNNRMFVIKNFKIETEEVTIPKTWLRKERKETKYFLTELKVQTYFPDYKSLGIIAEDDAYHIILFYDLSRLRESWENFVEQLKHFGVELRTIDKETIKE